MNFRVVAVLASVAFSASISCALAGTADLVEVSGKVLVNAGKGFLPAKRDMKIKPGFEIFVADDATATLHFLDGKCDVVLSPASVIRVDQSRLCQQQQANVAVFQGADGKFVITPANQVITPTAAGAAGIISPYYIAGGIFSIDAAAFASAVLEKPVSAP